MIAADAVIFDCDGVLVDVSSSYDAAIGMTADCALERFAGITSVPVGADMIEGFKGTGGFNDEIDLTYAAVLSLAAADRLGEDPRRLVADVVSNADESGIASVERYLESRVDLADLRRSMEYPGTARSSSLHAMFDQIFYGSDMYRKIFLREPEIEGPGFIEADRLIVSQKLLDVLSARTGGKMAIVTGRGLDAVRHPLGGMLDSFVLDACMFLEDGPRSMAKPNPESLVHAASKLSACSALYVGDSMEDIIMAKGASQMGHKVAFCGITGTARRPEERHAMFERAGADIILNSIHDMPSSVQLG